MFAQMAKLHFGREDGVESVLADMAVKGHKQTRYLETIAEQFTLLAPDSGDLEAGGIRGRPERPARC